MRNIMINSTKTQTTRATTLLRHIGQQMKLQRKSLQVSAKAVSEIAGISRVTLHRVEKGESSVNIGAYLSAATALDLDIVATPKGLSRAEVAVDRAGWIPARIQLADYPQLKQLGWHIHGVNALSPAEAHSIYLRNRRFLEVDQLSTSEQNLIEALNVAFDGQVQ